MTRRQLMRRRRLHCEALESRRMMAADFHFAHNFRIPEDTDGSGSVAPIDALVIINVLNRGDTDSSAMVDVNADGSVSPIDALTVINRLNVVVTSGEVVTSVVSTEARIARIEAAIASQAVPSNITVEEATQILETLRLGGSPELGDCPSTDEPSTEERLAGLTDRLTELGVDADKIETIVAAVQAQLDAGETDFHEIVDTVLEENGIDLQELIRNHRETEKIERIADRLTDLGVDTTIVDQVTSEMKDALAAGTPWTRDQLITRLTELGVDVTTLFPPPPSHGRRGADQPVDADQVQKRLEALDVDSTVISTIVAEIKAAEEAGSPMTRSQLFTRLQELGVTLPQRPTTTPASSNGIFRGQPFRRH